MADITMSEVAELTDPKLRAMATRVLRTLQLETEKAIAHHAEPTNFPLDEDPDSVERLLLSRFNELQPTKQRAVTKTVMASVRAPAAQRRKEYGDLAQINLHEPRAVAQQARVLALPAALKFSLNHLTTLTERNGPSLAASAIAVAPAIGASALQQTTDRLKLRLHSIKCMNETNFEPGNDEIGMFGIDCDENGETKKIPPFMVESNFNQGEEKLLGGKLFTEFNLREGGNAFPKTYCATIGVYERDLGGISKFLDKLWHKVKDRIVELVAAAVGGIIGGATIPGLGAIVGAAVGWAVANFFEWLISLFKDDPFKPVTISIKIPSLNARWPGGKTRGPNQVITSKRPGARYVTKVFWEVATS